MFKRRYPEVVIGRVLGIWIATALITVPLSHYLNTGWLKQFHYIIRMGMVVGVSVFIQAGMLMIFSRIPRRLVLQFTIVMNFLTYLVGWFLVEYRII